jgi:transposase
VEAEANLMLKVSSLFSQILAEIPRTDFEKLVAKHGTQRHAKGFRSWTQFVAMLFCHLARADSLREICHGLSCCNGKLVHLGVLKSPNKSTLSYANEHRSSELFRDLFWSLLGSFRATGKLGVLGKRKFRFKNKLLSFDSTTITLCLSLFPWADFRRHKGGVKVHVLLDHGDYMPSFVHITEARMHDSKVTHLLSLPEGSIIVLDRAYIDFDLFRKWNEEKVFFVTRMKKNASYDVTEQLRVPQNSHVLKDEIIHLSGVNTWEKYPLPLRRIVVWDDKNKTEIVLLTNHLKFGSTTISSIYKERWQIEVFFKTLKQNLKVKTFIGVSENALRIQIWTALIALLVIKWLHYLSKAGWSFSKMVRQLADFV